MPQISQFYGIIITMYYREHAPPHFHARYAEYKAEYVISDGERLAGRLPRRAETLVLDWLAMHRAELMANWDAMQASPPQPPQPVPPLP
jgi:hypothetical protein